MKLKKLASPLVATALIFGATTVAAPTASAGTYTTTHDDNPEKYLNSKTAKKLAGFVAKGAWGKTPKEAKEMERAAVALANYYESDLEEDQKVAVVTMYLKTPAKTWNKIAKDFSYKSSEWCAIPNVLFGGCLGDTKTITDEREAKGATVFKIYKSLPESAKVKVWGSVSKETLEERSKDDHLAWKGKSPYAEYFAYTEEHGTDDKEQKDGNGSTAGLSSNKKDDKNNDGDDSGSSSLGDNPIIALAALAAVIGAVAAAAGQFLPPMPR